MVCGRISLKPTTVTKGSSAKISISAVPPCPPPIIATRLEVTFDFDRRGLRLVMRGERGEGLGDGIDTHFHDRNRWKIFSKRRSLPLSGYDADKTGGLANRHRQMSMNQDILLSWVSARMVSINWSMSLNSRYTEANRTYATGSNSFKARMTSSPTVRLGTSVSPRS